MERTMTNEEKASEIVIKIQNSSSLDYDSRRAKYMYDSAMEMAQWKDERIYRDEFLKAEKEALINKACEWMGEFLRNHYIMRYEDYCEPCKDRIVEEFKQAMKGGE